MLNAAEAVRDELTGRVREMIFATRGISVKGRLNTLARQIGMPAGRLARYWYGLIPCPPAHEADKIRAHHKSAADAAIALPLSRRARALLGGAVSGI